VPADLSEFEQAQRIDQLQRTAENLQRQLIAAKHKTGELVEAVYRAAKEAATLAPPAKAVPPIKDKRKAKEEVALLHCSDWQTGKRTIDYNSTVTKERIERLNHKVISITEIQRNDHPVKKLAIAYTGDMIEGVCIFPGQAFEVDSTLYEQLFFTASLMESQVRTMAEHFEQVDVFTEYGNHGRIGRKGEFPAKDNMDLMCYRIVAGRTEDLSNVTWHISTNWFNMLTVGNYSALLVHGDEIKSFGGNTPAFGILRKVSAWASGVVPTFVDCYMGHFHQPLTLPIPRGGRIFVVPSTESGNEYAREFVAATGRPGQRLNFINPDKAEVTSEYLLWLD
jgi:hypothetical protein